jgi:hypothetical protein
MSRRGSSGLAGAQRGWGECGEHVMSASRGVRVGMLLFDVRRRWFGGKEDEGSSGEDSEVIHCLSAE